MKRILLGALCVLLLVCSCATEGAGDGLLHIRFFEVTGVDEWGDATLITFPNGETMMVDFGYEEAGAQIAAKLKEEGITHITYALFSHCHSDHVNGYKAFLDAGIRFDKAITTGYYTSGYLWMSSNFASYGMEEIIVTAGDSFDIGGVHFDVLWPVASDLDYATARVTENHSGGSGDEIGSNDHMNSTAMVFRMSYGDFSALFTGDIYQHAELDILELYKDNLSILDCDLLKAMHHGKATSSSQEFLNAVSPSVAVQLGTTPMGSSIYKRYCIAGAITYPTCQNGEVRISSDGSGYTVDADNMELTKTYQALVDAFREVK